MTDDTDKSLDDNENMVKALESIKNLLATSETKLSQARKSINQASAQSLKMTTKVPVLENVIVPGKRHSTTEDSDSGSVPSADALSTLQAQLETEMHEKLLQFTQQLELELKQKIKDYIEQHSNPQNDPGKL